MVHELKQHILARKVFFGIKQSLKNSKNLNKALLSSDCREEIMDLLEKNKIDIEIMDFSKQELADKLELDFKCEVFGLRK
ncbi:MAG: hypothetical protein IIA87_01870 [Nanoarchaeota archaeon]|nr:hypothetical protein [Nanoarchaeota archaeon]